MEAISFEKLPQFVLDLRDEVRELRMELQRKPEPPAENPEDLFTPDEVCDKWRISRTTLWRLDKDNKVKSVTIGGKRLYRRGDLLAALNSKK